jgi:inner membrane transporter RhtA
MLALLPAVATIIGFLVLGQTPTGQDLAGIALVIIGVALHHEPPARPPSEPAPSPAGTRV